MNDNKTKKSEDDIDIIALLKRHDPADGITPRICMDIEARVMARVSRPSLIQQAEQVLAEYLPDLSFGAWRVPWPVISASAVAFGLIFGLMSASIVETPMGTDAHKYVLTEAMAQPWDK